MPRHRPTQSDVARLANVSSAVVSAVINGSKAPKNIRISAETRERVMTAIAQLGYVPNPLAQRLAHGHNRIISIFTYEAVFPTSSHNTYFPYLEGIEQEAVAQQYDLLLCTRAIGTDGRRAIYRQGFNTLQVGEGAILLGRPDDEARRADLARLVREHYPFVFIGRRQIPEGPIAYVAPDSARATEDVIEHVIAQGHRRLAYIGRAAFNESYEDREHGFRTACRRHAVATDPLLFVRCEPEQLSVDAVNQLLVHQPTVLITEDTELAVPLIDALHQLALEVPRDVSLAVLGDVDFNLSLTPPITSFTTPRTQIGREVFRMLLSLLQAGAVSEQFQVRVPCELFPGATVARISSP